MTGPREFALIATGHWEHRQTRAPLPRATETELASAVKKPAGSQTGETGSNRYYR